VDFTDGHSKALSANLIAQNLFSRIDDEGNQHVSLEEIIDHRKTDAAVSKAPQTTDNTRVAAIMPAARRVNKLGCVKGCKTFVPFESS
jgi:hypothetical protein